MLNKGPEIKECPLFPEYLFKTKCTIKTCKYFSPAVELRCLVLSNSVDISNKSISDGELLEFKFFDTEMSEKEVSGIRKKSVEKVKNVIRLYNLFSYLRENYEAKEDITYEEGDIVSKILERKPLSIDKLDFELWMFRYLIDDEFINKICGPKFKIKDALLMNKKEYASLVDHVTAQSRS